MGKKAAKYKDRVKPVNFVADVEPRIAEGFDFLARCHERSREAHLRALIREYVEKNELAHD